MFLLCCSPNKNSNLCPKSTVSYRREPIEASFPGLIAVSGHNSEICHLGKGLRTLLVCHGSNSEWPSHGQVSKILILYKNNSCSYKWQEIMYFPPLVSRLTSRHPYFSGQGQCNHSLTFLILTQSPPIIKDFSLV